MLTFGHKPCLLQWYTESNMIFYSFNEFSLNMYQVNSDTKYCYIYLISSSKSKSYIFQNLRNIIKFLLKLLQICSAAENARSNQRGQNRYLPLVVQLGGAFCKPNVICHSRIVVTFWSKLNIFFVNYKSKN